MSTAIIITICSLLLIAYIFDLTSSKTKVPSVILLIILGWMVRQTSDALEIHIPALGSILPLLGTVGLILIVLEGALELELNTTKGPVIIKSSLMAFIPMIVLNISLTLAFNYFGGFSYKDSLINAIPLSVISSAIAIPSVRNFSAAEKEFVIYESSLSDIMGVLLFNFIVLNDTFGINTFGNFTLELILVLIISFVATVVLALLLSKIGHHVKFVPIILLVILLYAVSKVYHLPGLVFILIFGLFMGNLDELKRFRWIEKLQPEILEKEVHKFKEILGEGTFIVRALFFIVFGYLIETKEILNTDTFFWSAGIVAAIFTFRAVTLKILSVPLTPLLYVSPRGLITILLFFSIPVNHSTSYVNKSLIIQIIALTAIIMMFGIMKAKDVKGSDRNKFV